MLRRTPFIVLILAIAFLPAIADVDLTVTAKAYVEKFFTGEYDSYADLMGDDLKTAFPPAMAKQVLEQILSTNGAVKTIGDAWLEDEIEVYRRVRVPTEFENKTLDLRVVFNNQGKIVGFTQAPHVPSPAEMAADESLRSEPNPAMEGSWAGSIEIPGAALDLQVDPRQNLPEIRKALERAGNKDFTVEELKGLNHLFQTATTGSISEYYTIEETMSPAVLERITSWIDERFKKS